MDGNALVVQVGRIFGTLLAFSKAFRNSYQPQDDDRW